MSGGQAHMGLCNTQHPTYELTHTNPMKRDTKRHNATCAEPTGMAWSDMFTQQSGMCRTLFMPRPTPYQVTSTHRPWANAKQQTH